MSDEQEFFRPEAVEASRRRIGAPVRPVGVTSWAFTAFMLLIVVAVALFAVFARFARIESIPGSLEPVAGSSRVVAPRSAVVTQVHAVEGQVVRAGDPLFTLGSDMVVEGGAPLGTILREVSQAQSTALQTQGEAMRAAQQRQLDELAARAHGLRQRVERLRSDLALAEQRLELSQETLQSFEDLRMKGFLSEVRYRAQQAAVLDDRRSVSSISGEIDATNAALIENAASRDRLQAEARQSLAALETSRATLQERQATASAQAAVIITAHKAGRVTLQARQGSSVSEGGALAIILPPGSQLKAQLWASSRAAGFVQTGDEVRLLYDAFPYQRFGTGRGRVVAVSSAPTDPKDIPLALLSEEALYRIDVELEDQEVRAYGRSWPLAAGSRLTGDVVLESRSMLEWVLDPIRAIQQRRM